MGEMVASVELENATDRENAREGLRDRSTIRRTTVEGVDTSLAERKRSGASGAVDERGACL